MFDTISPVQERIDVDAWPAPGMLDAARPGPVLAALVNQVDLRACPDDQVVEVAAAASRLASWAASVEMAATAELTDRVRRWRGVSPAAETTEPGTAATADPDRVSPELMAASEIGAALALSPQSARLRVELARSLRRLPRTRFALAAGHIDLNRARVVVETLAVCDDETAAEVEARVLPKADGRTAAMLRASLQRAVLSADPAAASARRERAVRERGVHREFLPDGMGRFELLDAAENVEALYQWVTGRALAARAPDDNRTLDQIRADVLADIGHRGLAEEDLPTRAGRRPSIGVVVAATTLLGLDDEPGELVGVGPIPAEVARRIAGDGTWRRILTDPRTGRLDELGTDRYEPPQRLRDHVIARDRTCRGPGCRLRADRCDLDHRVPHPDGPTTAANLDAACRPWHRVKTHTDTKVSADTSLGLRITLPSGRSYERPAEPVLEHRALGPPDEEPPF